MKPPITLRNGPQITQMTQMKNAADVADERR